jgi:arginase family enzyme
MALAFLTGLETNPLTWKDNKLAFDNLIYFGIRDLDEFEDDLVYREVGKLMTSDMLMSNTPIENEFPFKLDNIHLSVDVDVLDPQFMSSTGTAVSFGIDMCKLENIINWTKNAGNIVAIDLVEYNPECENDEKKIKSDLKNYDKIIELLHDI